MGEREKVIGSPTKRVAQERDRVMLDKEKLRKADVFSGAAVFLFGAWIVSQAFGMPMKDSWGGVMNVWYVSPALLPLFIGSILMLLGLMLLRIGLKAVGFAELKKTLQWFSSRRLLWFLTSDGAMRFFAVAVLFLSLVFLNLPRIDFFISAVLFLSAFITMFYFYDDKLLKRLLALYLLGETGFILYFSLGMDTLVTAFIPFGTDVLALCFLIGYCLVAWKWVRHDPGRRKKYRIALTMAILAPFFIGPIFKYFLMVPMPKEGLVVAMLDYVWYLDFL
jgi:hypothetical protein